MANSSDRDDKPRPGLYMTARSRGRPQRRPMRIMAKNNIGLEELRLKRMVVTDDCLEMISTAGLIGGSLSDVLVFLRPDPFYFRFDRLGVRVPTLLISPWIEKGTVIHKPAGPTPSSQFEHSSIPMKSNFLTKRDAWAGSFESYFHLRGSPLALTAQFQSNPA
ncbi:hypothetical protein QQ045_023011 [Rhodiola kirilowii]